jgi:hypothetical protein
VLAFDGYVDSMLPSYHPSVSDHLAGTSTSTSTSTTDLVEAATPSPAPLVNTPSPLGIPAMGIPAKVLTLTTQPYPSS